MKRIALAGIVVLVGVVCLTALYGCEPERFTGERITEAYEAQQKLEQIEREKLEQEAAANAPEQTPAAETTAPPTEEEENVYRVKFETTAGDFTVAVHPDWAPLGAARFRELVEQGFYNDAGFFRVVPGFVVQFGMHADPNINERWQNSDIQDDPVLKSNKPGTLSFASRGPNTRTTQIFINLGDNAASLDGQGFSPFGEIVEGMDSVKNITSQYGQTPDQMQIRGRGNEYLKASFPNLDYIKKATIVEK